MTRAERRRAEKAAKKKPATYNLTIEQVNAMAREKYENDLETIRQEVTDTATNEVLLLLFGLPCMTLKEYYWRKSKDKEFLRFAERMLGFYRKWQNGEITDEEIKEWVWENV